MKRAARNPDVRLRELERRASQGDAQAAAQLLQERVRAGRVSIRNVQLAAALGHPVALRVAVPADLPPSGMWGPAQFARMPERWPEDTLDPKTRRLWAADMAERALRRELSLGREPHLDSFAAIEIARGSPTAQQLHWAYSDARAAANEAGDQYLAARTSSTFPIGLFRAAAAAEAVVGAVSGPRAGVRHSYGALMNNYKPQNPVGVASEEEWARDALARRLLGLEVTLWP